MKMHGNIDQVDRKRSRGRPKKSQGPDIIISCKVSAETVKCIDNLQRIYGMPTRSALIREMLALALHGINARPLPGALRSRRKKPDPKSAQGELPL
jgi:hypothetical protein